MKKCSICDKKFEKNPKYSKSQWERAKYCSFKCQCEGRTTRLQKNCLVCGEGFISKLYDSETHNYCSYGCLGISKQSDTPGYSSIHKWIYKNKPKTSCEQCGSDRFTQYANKTGEYLRDVNDWLILCAKCHHIYDNKSEKRRLTMQTAEGWIEDFNQ